MKYFFLLFLSGCSFTATIGAPAGVDTQARQSIQQLQTLIQGMGPAIDKAIDEKVAKAKK